MENGENQKPAVQFEDSKAMDNRLVNIGWALLLILIGLIWLLPENIVPQGAFLIGVGVILLCLNVIKIVKGSRISWATLYLGIIALVAGVRVFMKLNFPLVPIFLILLGILLIIMTFTKKK